MSYSFAAHTRELAPWPEQPPGHMFALIDAAQLQPLKRPLKRMLDDGLSVLVFEDTFAKSALDLSPVVLQLGGEAESFVRQVTALDAACHHLPAMSILRSSLLIDELVQHLRSLMMIEADGTAYLLRFADSQMLAAANSILMPTQRARFFKGISAWWTVDYHGHLHDQACASDHEQVWPAIDLPLQLDAAQTNALMTAVAVPVLASQVRNLDDGFARKLSHAEQMDFIHACLVAAREEAWDENEHLGLALQRWQAVEEGRA